MSTPGEAPIGVFDSGVGGLTVLAALERAVPSERLVYLGDTARVPYGTRSPETVVRYSVEAGRFFRGKGVKLLVVACNTASSVALPALEEASGVPVVGVIEPGARRAVRRTRNRKIGVIGTRATVASGAYAARIRALCPEAEVVSRACPLFVPLAEEGWTEGDVARGVAERYLETIWRADCDTVVLGCTHYPLLRGVIAETLGAGVTLVDSAESVAGEVAERLGTSGPRPEPCEPPVFYVTDDPDRFREVAERFLGRGEIEPIRESLAQ